LFGDIKTPKNRIGKSKIETIIPSSPQPNPSPPPKKNEKRKKPPGTFSRV